MKKLSSKMKILLVLAICTAFIVPSVALAGWTRPGGSAPGPVYLVNGTFEPGHHLFEGLKLVTKGTTTQIDVKVVNGDGKGDDAVSSVKITLLDEEGKPKEVIISPNSFSQNMNKKKDVQFSTVNGQIPLDSVESMDTFSLDLKVAGPKGSSITLSVIERFRRF